jgi:hypothetical protein
MLRCLALPAAPGFDHLKSDAVGAGTSRPTTHITRYASKPAAPDRE